MGYQELLIVLLIVLVLFGGAKIPQLMRGVGQGIREFKDGIDEGKGGPPSAPVVVTDAPKSENVKE